MFRASPPATQWDELSGPDRHAACLIAARAGDHRALSTLVADLTPLLWHVARANGLDRAATEDVVQTVWLSLLRHLHRLTEPRALASWLITTTRRESRRTRQLAARQAAQQAELSATLPDDSPTPDATVLLTERDRTLWRAFHRLPQRCQELLRLTVLAGHPSYRSVAAALHLPLGSIGPTRNRCLRTLRELYAQET